MFTASERPPQVDLELLDRIQERVLWLSTYLIHYANYIRPNRDSIKVGGHQASCASVVSMLTAYYFAAAESGDLIAIKPHASPVYHAIQYLLGNLSRERLLQFRSFGGLQAYPSRLKDPDGVHFSTGSVGFGAVMPNFMSLVRRYVEDHFGYDKPHRFLALMGDAELDEGNIWEALGEDHLQRLGRVIWMVDLNRQSLDRVVPNGRAQKITGLLRSFGCHVIEVKYGSRLEAIFARPGGERLRERIDLMSKKSIRACCASRSLTY
jgi:pyruvate dehydrogenase E1 component